MMPNMIDTHFHLDYYENYREIATRISELKQYTICVTNSPGVFISCKKMIPETKYLKFAIGFHPLENRLNEIDLAYFLHLINQTRYIGEIGLDFSKSSCIQQEKQLRYFEAIVAKCTSVNSLMTIHIRKAESQAIKIIKKYAPKKCIIHWYTGTEKQMIELLELGCYMSVNTNMITNKSCSKYLQIPKNRLLIESDGPYTKVSGRKYTPDLLKKSYNQISKFYGYPDLAFVVSSNFRTILAK